MTGHANIFCAFDIVFFSFCIFIDMDLASIRNSRIISQTVLSICAFLTNLSTGAPKLCLWFFNPSNWITGKGLRSDWFFRRAAVFTASLKVTTVYHEKFKLRVYKQ